MQRFARFLGLAIALASLVGLGCAKAKPAESPFALLEEEAMYEPPDRDMVEPGSVRWPVYDAPLSQSVDEALDELEFLIGWKPFGWHFPEPAPSQPPSPELVGENANPIPDRCARACRAVATMWRAAIRLRNDPNVKCASQIFDAMEHVQDARKALRKAGCTCK